MLFKGFDCTLLPCIRVSQGESAPERNSRVSPYAEWKCSLRWGQEKFSRWKLMRWMATGQWLTESQVMNELDTGRVSPKSCCTNPPYRYSGATVVDSTYPAKGGYTGWESVSGSPFQRAFCVHPHVDVRGDRDKLMCLCPPSQSDLVNTKCLDVIGNTAPKIGSKISEVWNILRETGGIPLHFFFF